MGRSGGGRWLRVTAVAVVAAAAAAAATSAAAAAAPSGSAAAAADAEPGAAVATAVANATAASGGGRDGAPTTGRVGAAPAAAGEVSAAAKSSGWWCTYRSTCIAWYYQADALYRYCLPPYGAANHDLARQIMYSVLVDLYYAITPSSCCFDGATTERIESALSGVAPYILPTCSVFSSRSARGDEEGGEAGGGGGGGRRATVGGDHPLDAVARDATGRPAEAAAAPAAAADGPMAGTEEVKDGDDNDDDAATAAEGTAGDAARAAATGAAGGDVASAAADDAAARVVINSGNACCTEYEEYEPYHTHPCCHTGCRIAAQYLPLITQESCCNYRHQRPSTGEWYFTNREGRYC